MAAIAFAIEQSRRAEARHLPGPCHDDFLRLSRTLIHGPEFQWLLVEAPNEGLRRQVMTALDNVLQLAGLSSNRLPLSAKILDVPMLEERLVKIARSAAVVHVFGQSGWFDAARWEAFNRKRDAVSRETQRLKSAWVHPAVLPSADAERLLGKALEHEHSLLDLLRRPGIGFDAVAEVAAIARPEAAVSRETLRAELGAELADAVIEQVEIATRYAGYIDKQQDEVARAAAYEHLPLPADLDYQAVKALSFEVRQKLSAHRPETLGHASRVPGVTPAAISLLLVHLKKGRLRQDRAGREEGAAPSRVAADEAA